MWVIRIILFNHRITFILNQKEKNVQFCETSFVKGRNINSREKKTQKINSMYSFQEILLSICDPILSVKKANHNHIINEISYNKI